MTCPTCPSARSTPSSANAHGKDHTSIPSRRRSCLPLLIHPSLPHPGSRQYTILPAA
ncbi:hypothetical protein FIBSPDRAFT_878213 [Athelia psychrophila]|uniref:Uncharacterized protein n=1 Tax=Athelia psychrophila TaxID=1759441 RepID=A0A167V7Q2_9AGAM|nr:hypothetical protein FIBSPDRAFT_878213 [Fibularhizoctonia sp. CBS 109695]